MGDSTISLLNAILYVKYLKVFKKFFLILVFNVLIKMFLAEKNYFFSNKLFEHNSGQCVLQTHMCIEYFQVLSSKLYTLDSIYLVNYTRLFLYSSL